MSLSVPSIHTLTDAERIAESHAFCANLTRISARNFYYGLKLLPQPKRSAMFALYAYMRIVDDIADQDDGRLLEQRVADLEAWRTKTHAVLTGGAWRAEDSRSVWPAFAEMARNYDVPIDIFDHVIAGQHQDLRSIDFNTFEQLREYCYRVAGVIGLASIRVWGYSGGKETEQLAIHRGIAFQLTNILRDLREDSARGRVYLPREELQIVGLNEEDLLHGRADDRFEELMRFQIARAAESCYEQSRGLERRIDADSRPTLIAMTDIYHGLLRKIAAEPRASCAKRVSLSVVSKLRIGWRAMRLRQGGTLASQRLSTTAAAADQA